MTMHAIANARANLEQRTRAADFITLARTVMAMRGDRLGALEAAKAAQAPSHIVAILKANLQTDIIARATDAGTIRGDATESPDSWGSHLGYHDLAQAWLESLHNSAIFDAALSSMRPAVLRSKVGAIDAGAVATIVGEAAAKPITSIAGANIALEEKKAACTVIVSSEMLKVSTLADAVLNRELRAGVSAAVDDEFLSALISDTTPISSSGHFLYDLELLLGSIDASATSRFFLAIEPDELRRLAVMEAATGGRAFPELGVNGGNVGGVVVMPSDQLDSGKALLFDADAIAANGGSVGMSAARHANVDMSGGNTATFSLWQKNSVGLRVERRFGFSLLRPTAVASLSNVTYASDSPSA